LLIVHLEPSIWQEAKLAGGPAFALHFGRPILDDFQGWGFRPVINGLSEFHSAKLLLI
jgi:hypothetical protein